MADIDENGLDAHALAETYDWQRRNYEQAVRRVVDVIVDSIQIGTKDALGREIRYDSDLRDAYTFIDQASEIEHQIIQALNNADLRGLTRAAGEVHATASAIALLDRFKASLPAGMRETIEERETVALQRRVEEARERVAAIEARDANDCRAAVHERGRGVGFYRCTKTGTVEFTVDSRPGYLGRIVDPDDPNATTVKVCGTHAAQARRDLRVHVWTPSKWEADQSISWRDKTRRELARMEARLPRQLTEGDPVEHQ